MKLTRSEAKRIYWALRPQEERSEKSRNMALKRWSTTSREERVRHAKKMVKARAKIDL
jgi:hypothetical protein